MHHMYKAENGETLELTAAIVTVAELEQKIVKDLELSTEHVTYWKKVQ